MKPWAARSAGSWPRVRWTWRGHWSACDWREHSAATTRLRKAFRTSDEKAIGTAIQPSGATPTFPSPKKTGESFSGGIESDFDNRAKILVRGSYDLSVLGDTREAVSTLNLRELSKSDVQERLSNDRDVPAGILESRSGDADRTAKGSVRTIYGSARLAARGVLERLDRPKRRSAKRSLKAGANAAGSSRYTDANYSSTTGLRRHSEERTNQAISGRSAQIVTRSKRGLTPSPLHDSETLREIKRTQPTFKPLSFGPSVVKRDAKFFETIHKWHEEQLRSYGYVWPYGWKPHPKTKVKLVRGKRSNRYGLPFIPRIEWPPKPGEPVYGWRAVTVAHMIDSLRRRHRFIFRRRAWFVLKMIMDRRIPFSLGALVILEREYYRQVERRKRWLEEHPEHRRWKNTEKVQMAGRPSFKLRVNFGGLGLTGM